MSMRGASRKTPATPKHPLHDLLLNVEQVEYTNGLQYFGADTMEIFGAPDEPPSTLLWLANGIYHAAAKVVEVVTTCSIRPKRD